MTATMATMIFLSRQQSKLSENVGLYPTSARTFQGQIFDFRSLLQRMAFFFKTDSCTSTSCYTFFNDFLQNYTKYPDSVFTRRLRLPTPSGRSGGNGTAAYLPPLSYVWSLVFHHANTQTHPSSMNTIYCKASVLGTDGRTSNRQRYRQAAADSSASVDDLESRSLTGQTVIRLMN